jgi:glycosyltransferase involved in cell wall biosynthesis
MNRRLRIAGTGPEETRLRRMAEGDARIEFLGELSNDDLWREYARARALLFAADEDFGMVPLEAQACGRPVIAYGAGGSLETVNGAWSAAEATVDTTGTYFKEQSPAAVAEAIARWEDAMEERFDPEAARRWAAQFATPIFLERYRAFVLGRVPEAESVCASAGEAAATVLY